MITSLSALLLVLLGAGPELDAARRTRVLIEEKLAARETNLRARVVALYKLDRFGELPAWVDDGARREMLRRRDAARRMILRDLEERQALRADLDAARADEARLLTEAPVPRPLDASLGRPVPGRTVVPYGVGVDPDTGLRVVRRGIELHAVPGAVVSAVAPGRVLYAGAIRGLGEGVIVEHGKGQISVTGRLEKLQVARGDDLDAGAFLGVAAGDEVHLEVRIGGRPLDPAPLLLPQ